MNPNRDLLANNEAINKNPFSDFSICKIFANSLSYENNYFNSSNLLDNFDFIKCGSKFFSRHKFSFKENIEQNKLFDNYSQIKVFNSTFDENNIDESSINHKNNAENEHDKSDFIKKIDNIPKNLIIKKPKSLRKIFNLKIYDKDFNLITKKRGRISSLKLGKKQEHIHSAMDYDNILRKIQVHFMSFLVNFTNDYIFTIKTDSNEGDVPYFRQIDYKIKRQITHSYIKKLKYQKIGTILQYPISKKNRACKDNQNILIYQQIVSLYPFLEHNYLNKSFRDFFVEYYYNQDDNDIYINGDKINLSIKTKTFNDLIKKNANYSDKFKNIAYYFYIYDEENNNKIIEIKEEKDDKTNAIKQKPFFITE